MTSCGPVSVIIPTRNRSHLMIRAIESALSCGEACGEVIVVDDRSTDDTRSVVSAITDPRVRCLASPVPGAPAARNLGLREARYHFIKFLDDDDFLLPGSLSSQLRAFERVEAASRDRTVVYGDALVTGRYFMSHPKREVPSRRRPSETDVEYLTRVNVMTSCPLHQRHLLEEVGGFDESLPSYQENDLHLRLALNGVNFVSVPGDIYVFDNASGRHRISTRARDRDVVAFRLAFLRRRREMLAKHFMGTLPITVRRALALDLRECQRWARHADLDDLERLCEKEAMSLQSIGPFARLRTGWWVYGLAKRIRSKIAKRLRGAMPLMLRRGSSVLVRTAERETNVTIGDRATSREPVRQMQ